MYHAQWTFRRKLAARKFNVISDNAWQECHLKWPKLISQYLVHVLRQSDREEACMCKMLWYTAREIVLILFIPLEFTGATRPALSSPTWCFSKYRLWCNIECLLEFTNTARKFLLLFYNFKLPRVPLRAWPEAQGSKMLVSLIRGTKPSARASLLDLKAKYSVVSKVYKFSGRRCVLLCWAESAGKIRLIESVIFFSFTGAHRGFRIDCLISRVLVLVFVFVDCPEYGVFRWNTLKIGGMFSTVDGLSMT